ncbi:MAG: BlaI/MecI/CopY family transcriptional regulator [Verrucomicrobiota bacterium]
MNQESKLSSREREIMDLVWRIGEATARQVQEALPDKPANATVRTILRILEGKGYLTHREEGRKFIYAPVESREKTAESALRRLLGVFYNGSVSEAVSGLLQMKDTNLNADELERLEEMIRTAKQKEKSNP